MPASDAIVDKVDIFFKSVADWSLRNRAVVILMTLAVLLPGLYLASKVHVDNSLNAYFDKSDPTYDAYLEYLQDFGSDEIIYILYDAPQTQHGVFDYDVMQSIAHLTETLEQEVPFVNEVTSLANVEFMQVNGDELIIDDLLIDFPDTQEQLLALRERVLSKPAYINYLTTQDARYAAIFIEMTRTSSDPLEKIIHDADKGAAMHNLYPQVSIDNVAKILARPEYSHINFRLTGDVAVNSAYNTIISKDAAISLILTLLLIVVLSYILFRTPLKVVLGPITVVLISLILTVALMSAMDWRIGLLFSMIPTLICAVGVAQSVHFLLEYQRAFNLYQHRNQAVSHALQQVGAPCLMAAATTAIGFLVMVVSELHAIRELAIYAAVGVMFTFLFTVTLLVVLLGGNEQASEKAQRERKQIVVSPFIVKMIAPITQFTLNHRVLITAASAVIFLFSFAGISRLTVDFNFIGEFKERVEIRKNTDFAEDIMGGLMSVVYEFDTQQEDGIKNREFLSQLNDLQQYAESLPLVKKSFAVTDILKDLNQSLNQDNPDFYRLPDDQATTSQYFLVYEVSGGQQLGDLVSHDSSRTVLELRVEVIEASRIESVIDDIDAYLDKNPITLATKTTTGIGLLWVKMGEYISNTQIISYSLVFLLVAIVMCVVFGSIKVGLLSMIPNTAPVIVTLGLMGWLQVHLDYMKLTLATIAIGIAVDDTIHLVTRYRHRFREVGNYEIALGKALQDVGPALIVTSFILIGAFSSYLLSDTNILASFGALLATTILVALAADLLLMPAIIMALKPFGKEFASENQTSDH